LSPHLSETTVRGPHPWLSAWQRRFTLLVEFGQIPLAVRSKNLRGEVKVI